MKLNRQKKTSTSSIQYSIVVPTYKEKENLQPLIEQVFAALAQYKIDKQTEMVVVDDNSQDGSAELVQKLSDLYPVRIIVRTTERGLSSAVLCGFKASQGQILLCMDADLQHPPSSVPLLLQALDPNSRKAESNKKDKEDFPEMVIGTRYPSNPTPDFSSVDKDWPLYRRIVSEGARLMARPLTSLSDPMTGFFALQRQAWERGRVKVNPIGFKIAMELFVKCGIQRHVEVPIRFGVRVNGESKLSAKVMVGYLRHLAELYVYRMGWFLLILVVLVLVVGMWAVLRLSPLL